MTSRSKDPTLPAGCEVEVSYKFMHDASGRLVFYDTMAVLMKDGEPVAVGVTYLSPKDKCVKKVGRHKAIGRAIQAYLRDYPKASVVTFKDEVIEEVPFNGPRI